MKEGFQEKLGIAIDMAWKKMSDRTWDNTLKDKANFTDVTEQDWQNSSFTIDELKEEIIKNFTSLLNK